MKYFIITNDVQQGPFSTEELSQHNITSDTLVWAEGMAQWTPAWQVAELKPLFYGQSASGSTATPPPPPPFHPTEDARPSAATPNSGSAAHLQDAELQLQPERKSSHRGLIFGIILVGLLLFMGITNPSKDEHRMVIKENVTRGLTKALANQGNDFLSQGMAMLGKMLAAPIVDGVLDNMLQYHNYLFFSTTSIETKDGNTTTSYGLCGKVFTAGEEKIASVISKAMDTSLSKEMTATNEQVDGVQGQTNSGSNADPNALQEDTTSLQRQIGNVIIDHLGRQVKKQISENTDSTMSRGIGEVVDDVVKLIKGL